MDPSSILGDVRGFARDFALDQLPKGYVWDLVDYIPRRRGARLDARGPWAFLSPSSLPGLIWGGLHAPFRAGASLLVCANPNVYEVNPTTGVATLIGTLFSSGKQNGVILRDRAYFADGQALQPPKYVTRSGATHAVTALGASAPPSSLLGVYKSRLICAGNPAAPERLYFSPLETAGGPPGTWDSLSYWDSSLEITALWAMGAQILLFHNGSIEKLRGGIPPGVDVDTDMSLEPFTDQMGCSDPASVVGWQENVCWASSRGVYLSDGSTIRSLTEQGGIAELWRNIYSAKRAGTQVVATVFLDLLFVSVLTDWVPETPLDLRHYMLVCNLTERTWWRFANLGMTAAIPSATDGEQVWWAPDGVGHDAAYSFRLSRFSDMLNIPGEAAQYAPGPPVDAVDGNTVPVLPQVETGFIKLGPEGVKRIRHIYVSHTTATATPSPANKLRVSYRLRPHPQIPYTFAADIPGGDEYKRERIRLGKHGYGITVKVEQLIPTWRSRLHDIAVDQWAVDRGHL